MTPLHYLALALIDGTPQGATGLDAGAIALVPDRIWHDLEEAGFVHRAHPGKVNETHAGRHALREHVVSLGGLPPRATGYVTA